MLTTNIINLYNSQTYTNLKKSMLLLKKQQEI